MTSTEQQQQTEAAAAAATGQQQGGGQQQGSQGGQQQGANQGGGGQQHDDSAPKFTQADVNRIEANIRRDYQGKAEKDKALIEKGKEYEALLAESQPLSERVETLSGTVAERDQTLAARDLTITRMQLAWEAGLPPALGARVQGNTADEIKADIEQLKAFAVTNGGQQQQQGGARPNPQQGRPSAGDTNRTGSVSAGRDLWAERHGQKANAAT